MRCIAKNKNNERCKNHSKPIKIFYCKEHSIISFPFFIKNKWQKFIYRIFLPIIFIGVIFFKSVVNYESLNFYKKIKKTTITHDSSYFNEDSSFKILILPFTSSSYCNEKTILCEREIKKFFDENYNPKTLETVIDYNLKQFNIIHTFEEAKSIALKTKANIILWGDFSNKCSSDSTKVELSYLVNDSLYNRNLLLPSKNTLLEENILFSELKEGKILVDVDDVINWILGLKEFRAKQLKNCIKYFEKISISLEKEYLQVFYLLGLSYLLLDEPQKSIYYNTIGLKIDPNNILLLTHRSSAFKQSLKCDSALMDINRVIQLIEGRRIYPDAYNDRANFWIACQEYNLKQVINDYNTAIKIDSMYTLAYLNKAMFLYTIGDTSKTLNLLLKANKIESSIESNLYLAAYYFLKGNYRKSEEFVNKAILIDSSLPNGYLFRIKLNQEFLKNEEKVKIDFRRLSEILIEVPENYILIITGLILNIDLRKCKSYMIHHSPFDASNDGQ